MAETVNTVARGVVNVIVISVKVFDWDFAIAEVDQLVLSARWHDAQWLKL